MIVRNMLWHVLVQYVGTDCTCWYRCALVTTTRSTDQTKVAVEQGCDGATVDRYSIGSWPMQI